MKDTDYEKTEKCYSICCLSHRKKFNLQPDTTMSEDCYNAICFQDCPLIMIANFHSTKKEY